MLRDKSFCWLVAYSITKKKIFTIYMNKGIGKIDYDSNIVMVKKNKKQASYEKQNRVSYSVALLFGWSCP
jgi:hypothetical protein